MSLITPFLEGPEIQNFLGVAIFGPGDRESMTKTAMDCGYAAGESHG
jgi:hypothetical protein